MIANAAGGFTIPGIMRLPPADVCAIELEDWFVFGWSVIVRSRRLEVKMDQKLQEWLLR